MNKRKLVGSFLIFISGFIMLIDVFLVFFNFNGTDFGVTNLHGFNSFTNLVSFLCQWKAILIVIIGATIGAYKLSYISPIYSVLISIYWVLNDCYGINKPFFVVSVIGETIVFLLILSYLNKRNKEEKYKEEIINQKLKLLDNILDLNLLTSKKVKGDGR